MSGWRLAMQMAGIGWYVAVCIVLGVFAGLWLDSKFETSPIFLLGGTLLGVVTAFYGMYKLMAPFLNDSSDDGVDGKRKGR